MKVNHKTHYKIIFNNFQTCFIQMKNSPFFLNTYHVYYYTYIIISGFMRITHVTRIKYDTSEKENCGNTAEMNTE